MTARKALSSAESRAASRDAIRIGGWGLAIYTGVRVVALLFQSASMASVVAQAVLTEWGLGRLGVAWSDPKAKMPTGAQIAKRAGIGIAIGALVAAIVVAFLVTTRAVILDRASTQVGPVVVALVTACVLAMRDELLLHGLVMRMMASVESSLPKVLACGVTSAAAAYGEPGTSPRVAAVQGLLGLVFGALWVRDRGAWPAWGAHAAWLFVTGALLQGGLFEGRPLASAWGGADAGALGGIAAIVALVPFAIGALAGITRHPTSP